MVDSNMIHCFLVQTTTTITQALYQVQTILAYYLKTNHLHIKKNTKASRTLSICVPISTILVLVLNGCFLQQTIANIPVMALLGQLKQHVAKQSLQRSLNNQILHYKSMLDLCENEMMSIRVFWNL